MQLIDNWKQSYKFLSVIVAGALAVFDALHAALPALQLAVEPQTFSLINTAVAVAIIVARNIKQALPECPPDAPAPSSIEGPNQ